MTTKTAATLLLLSAAGVHGQAAAFDPAETCDGKAEGAECWHQLDSHPGCHVWNSGLRAEQTARWSGACNGSVLEGEGVLTWADPEDATVYEGALVGGKLHGRASVTFGGDGTVSEGPYANGLRSGRWRVTYTNGTVSEGIFANGHRAGRWVAREANGTVAERFFVNGEIHGTMVFRHSNGAVSEIPALNANGQIHGRVIDRQANGDVSATPYVNGKKHGTLADDGILVSRKRIARLMRESGLSGVSRRKRPTTTRRAAAPLRRDRRRTLSTGSLRPRHRTGFGWPTSPTCRRYRASSIWPSSLTCSVGESSAGPWIRLSRPSSWLAPSRWRSLSAGRRG